MRVSLLIALLVLCIFHSYGQSRMSLTLYQNTDKFEVEYHDVRTNERTQSRRLNFNRFCLAAHLLTETDYYHEVELIIPEFSKSLDKLQYPLTYEFRKDYSFEGRANSSALRYEFGKIFKNKDQRVWFQLAVGITAYYVFIDYEPNVPSTYPWQTTYSGFATHVSPGLTYRITRRVQLCLSTPLKFHDLRFEKQRIVNPMIPVRYQTNLIRYGVIMEPVYTIRFGVRVQINKGPVRTGRQ